MEVAMVPESRRISVIHGSAILNITVGFPSAASRQTQFQHLHRSMY